MTSGLSYHHGQVHGPDFPRNYFKVAILRVERSISAKEGMKDVDANQDYGADGFF